MIDLFFSTPMIFYWALTLFIAAQVMRPYITAIPVMFTLSYAGGMLLKVVFLVFYGISTVWWVPFVVAVVDFLAMGVVCSVVKNRLGTMLAWLGFIAVPVLGFYMFFSLYR